MHKSMSSNFKEINKNKAIASLRIHVERQMERIKNWPILDRRMPITMAPYASYIVVIITVLANFLPPLFLKFDIHVTVSFAGVDPGIGGELFVGDDKEKPSGLNNYLI